MSDESERPRLLKILQDRLAAYKSLDPEKMVGIKRWGEENALNQLGPLVVDLVGFVTGLTALPLDRAPYALLSNLVQTTGSVENAVQRLNSYKPGSQGSPSREEIITDFQNAFQAFVVAAAPVIAFASMQDTLRTEAKSVLAALEGARASEVENAKQKAAEISTLEKAMNEARASVGKLTVGDYKDKFAAHAKSYRTEAWSWLALTLAIGATLAGGIVWLVKSYPIDKAAQPGLIAEYVVARVGPIAIMFFFVTWCARNYRNARHLAEVNDHRSNALNTFATFVETSKDDPTRNAVLLEATRCIFAPVATGFGGGEDESNPTRIIEVLRTIGTGKGEPPRGN